jgi:nitrogen fixation NifU-like protein
VPLAEPQFDDLYRDIILDHYRRPRNQRAIAGPTHTAEGMNPVCGDQVRLDLVLNGDVIADVSFEGQGCSISQCSASMLTEQLKGRSVDEANHVCAHFRGMLTEGEEPAAELGDLEALQGVAQFPVRVKCAMLSWNVLQEALGQGRAAPGGARN